MLSKAASALGWTSIALGLSEILSPKKLEDTIGVDHDHQGLLRAMGFREIVSGLVILSGFERAGLWARVAGDAMDLALLGAATRETRKPRGLGSSMAIVAAITAMDVLAAVGADKKAIRRRQRSPAPARMGRDLALAPIK